jgi:aspartyl-tRNA(Asn)/glutamyl-tRNA(Gln) amidotransferase subunit B
MNSFKFVERAIEYEVARQAALLKNGKQVTQETLLFDSVTNTTRPMRSKEESADYRYFPDPDLPPLVVEESYVHEVQERMPKLPEQWLVELTTTFGLSEYDARVLVAERQNVEFFNRVFTACGNAKGACNWVTSELFGLLNKAQLDLNDSPVSAENLGELIRLIDDETISGKMAKSVFEEMFTTRKSAKTIVDDKGLRQITRDEDIAQLVNMAFDKNPSQLSSWLSGNDRIKPFFVGEVMKSSGGSANPKKVNEILSREIEKRRVQ